MPEFSLPMIALAIAGVLILMVLSGVRSVPQGSAWTIERFGRYTRTLKPGLNFVIPIIDKVGSKLWIQEQVLDVPSQSVITKDNAEVATDAVVFFTVTHPEYAAYQVRDLERAMQNLSMTNIRTVFGAMDLDEVLSEREKINDRLMKIIDEATEPWGVKVTRIEIKDISPPKDLVDAMSRQMKAERDKRAQILEAEGQREAEVRVAEGQKKAAILKAEGEKEAAELEAQARERLAQAEAKATEVVSKAVSEGDPRALHYFIGQKQVEAMQAFAKSENQKVFFLPADASAQLGALGGITELMKEIGK